MNILHLYESSILEQVGGTERFVHEIARRQVARGHQVRVVYYAAKQRTVDVDGVTYQSIIDTFTTHLKRQQTISCLGIVDHTIAGLYRMHEPEIVHLHGHSPRCGLSQILQATKVGIGSITSVHTPSFLCPNATLINQFQQVCDGVVEANRCTQCRLRKTGVPSSLASLLSRVSLPNFMANSDSRLGNLGTSRQATIWNQRRLGAYAGLPTTYLHVFNSWMQEILIRNGYPDNKIKRIGHGGPESATDFSMHNSGTNDHNPTIRFVFIGRIEPVKGLHLLIQALTSIPVELGFTLDAYGNGNNKPYLTGLHKLIKDHSNIRLHASIQPADVATTLSNYHCLLVPSLWLETGPLVVLEAFAMGLWVAGSNLGGILELCQGQPGCNLVQPTVKSWRTFFLSTINQTKMKKRQKRHLRTYGDVADNLIDCYQEIQKQYAPLKSATRTTNQ
ncbi:glycosyltransferase [Synechococcus sp. CS-1325]|uniref:glycosyltransferase n=1 Tax=Synechococcus sp. CS-1325 TaxID=2847979 RepID=UPI00223BCE00|nr:glycosyltransferase [Synechococcus sp. CS-1325]MCT0198167.1 glycosyltransferase [Synechococcus sp. CS-1325]